MPRSVGSLTPAWFSDPQVVRAYYLRMDWGGSIGTLRWTTKQTYPATVDARDMGDGAGTVNWDGTKAWKPGAIQEGSQNPLTISDMIFDNQANEFSDLLYLAGGIRGVPFRVWCAGFANTSPHAYVDKFVLFNGEGERAEIGDTVQVSLTPLKHPINMPFPRRRFTPAHGFLFLPPPNLKVWWGSNQYSPATPSSAQTGSGTTDQSIPVPGARMRVVPLPPPDRGTIVVNR